jgi:taurine dioxygenase
MSSIEVRPVGYAMGAEITGVDLSGPLGAEDLGRIKDAWFKHQVLVFPKQDLSPDALIAFSSNFGELDNHESQPFNRLPGYDEVMLLSNRPVGGTLPPGGAAGVNWHTDLSYTIRPATGTFLYCMEKPQVGGDTMFANMYTAYETLSPKMRAFLDDLEAVHDVGLINTKRAPEVVAEFKRLNPPVVHPAVRVHPETGRKALYVNDRVRTFVGLSEAESKPIIKFLCEHSVTPKFTYRHQWKVGDLVVWDNRCLTHMAVGDFAPKEVRHMIRTSCRGEYRGRFEDPQAAAPKALLANDAVAAAISAMHD